MQKALVSVRGDESASSVLIYDEGSTVSNDGRLVEIEKWFIVRGIRGAYLFFHLVSGIVHLGVVLYWFVIDDN